MARADMSNCGAPCCAEGASGTGPLLQGKEHEFFLDAVQVNGNWHLPTKNGFCIKLTADKKCSIYGNHPQVCKDFSCQVNYGCFDI